MKDDPSLLPFGENCLIVDEMFGNLWLRYDLALISLAKRVSFESGKHVVFDGATPETLYFLLRGRARMRSADGCTAEFDVGPTDPPRMIGLLAILADFAFAGELLSLTRCEFALISADHLKRFLADRPDGNIFITKTISLQYQNAVKILAGGDFAHRRGIRGPIKLGRE